MSERDMMFLDPAEIAKLTGYKRRANQLLWLKDEGYPHKVNRRGEIIISRAYVEAKLGLGKPPPPEPDFSVYAQ